jgi:hypothetical protein
MPSSLQVRFICPEYKANPGQYLALVGSDLKMGAWDGGAALPMEWAPGHSWAVELELSPTITDLEFKLVLAEGGAVVAWEPGANRKLRLPDHTTAPLTDVVCSWGIPRAEVWMGLQPTVWCEAACLVRRRAAVPGLRVLLLPLARV